MGAERLTILVVDDQPDVVSLLADWVKHEGHVPVGAGSLAEALGVLRAMEIDIAVTDLVMPRGGGIELIGEIKAQWPHVRVLAISGAVGETDEAARAAGADTFLRKPLRLAEFAQALSAGASG